MLQNTGLKQRLLATEAVAFEASCNELQQRLQLRVAEVEALTAERNTAVDGEAAAVAALLLEREEKQAALESAAALDQEVVQAYLLQC